MDRAPDQVWCRAVVLGPRGVLLATTAVGGTGPPDIAVVGCVARWALAARRGGRALVMRAMCGELRELLDLAGLSGQVWGEPEGGKHPLGVEEGIDGRDPAL